MDSTQRTVVNEMDSLYRFKRNDERLNAFLLKCPWHKRMHACLLNTHLWANVGHESDFVNEHMIRRRLDESNAVGRNVLRSEYLGSTTRFRMVVFQMNVWLHASFDHALPSVGSTARCSKLGGRSVVLPQRTYSCSLRIHCLLWCHWTDSQAQ